MFGAQIANCMRPRRMAAKWEGQGILAPPELGAVLGLMRGVVGAEQLLVARRKSARTLAGSMLLVP